MAHEINNPLAGIIQNTQVILNRMRDDNPRNLAAARECGVELDTVRQYLEKRGILQSTEMVREIGIRASRIVENMLDFARRSTSEHRYHDPKELLERTLALAASDFDLKKSYDFKRIEIEREYDGDVPDIYCNASKIQQVLLNILENGRPRNGEAPQRLEGFDLQNKDLEGRRYGGDNHL